MARKRDVDAADGSNQLARITGEAVGSQEVPEIPWPRVIREMMAIASAELPRRYWRRTKGGIPPGGQTAQDIVNAAFVRAFERREAWRDLVSLERILVGYIRHRISRLSKRKDNQDVRSDATVEIDGEPSMLHSDIDTAHAHRTDHGDLLGPELTIYSDQLLAKTRRCLEGDYWAKNVFNYMYKNKETAPRKIAQDLGITVSAVNAAKRRVHRKLFAEFSNLSSKPRGRSPTDTSGGVA